MNLLLISSARPVARQLFLLLAGSAHLAFAGPLETALDAPGLAWRADSVWTAVAGATARDGIDAVRVVASRDDIAGNSSGVLLETTVSGPGVFRFWWKGVSGDDDESLILELNGKGVLYRDVYPSAWQLVALNVAAGTHRIGVRAVVDHQMEAMLDEVSWRPGERLPAAVALGDPDGVWIQQGDWQVIPGSGADGGDALRLHLPTGDAEGLLGRVFTAPVLARYSRKLESTALGSLPGTWQLQEKIIIPQDPDRSPIDLFYYGPWGTTTAETIWLDSLTFTPLSLSGSLDSGETTARFRVSEGSQPWLLSDEEGVARGTGSASLAPRVSNGWGEVEADFHGPGLLTWAWHKWSDLNPAPTSSVNGVLLRTFSTDSDYLIGFAHEAQLLSGTELNTIKWHFQWEDNALNPMSLDDIVFSPAAPAAVRDALDLAPEAKVYQSGTGWLAQSAVTHDGGDAMELAPALGSLRPSLTLNVKGPGVLTWWWRAELPPLAEFNFHRQGRLVRTISGSSPWQQSFLVLRPGEEFGRWEILLHGTVPDASHRVWLDQVAFTPDPPDTPSIADALDSASAAWTTSGGSAVSLAVPWSFDGKDAFILTGPHRDQRLQTWLQGKFNGPGMLFYMVRTEVAPEILSLHFDQARWGALELDGQVATYFPTAEREKWLPHRLSLPEGTHILRWLAPVGMTMSLDSFRFFTNYASWADVFLLPPQKAGPMDDPDGDGSANLLEYAFGSSPMDPNPPTGVLVSIRDDSRGIEFQRDTALKDLHWQAEISTDLIHWENAPGSLMEITGTRQNVRVALPPDRPFGRIRISVIP